MNWTSSICFKCVCVCVHISNYVSFDDVHFVNMWRYTIFANAFSAIFRCNLMLNLYVNALSSQLCWFNLFSLEHVYSAPLTDGLRRFERRTAARICAVCTSNSGDCRVCLLEEHLKTRMFESAPPNVQLPVNREIDWAISIHFTVDGDFSHRPTWQKKTHITTTTHRSIRRTAAASMISSHVMWCMQSIFEF